jgi:hypothetical protein
MSQWTPLKVCQARGSWRTEADDAATMITGERIVMMAMACF